MAEIAQWQIALPQLSNTARDFVQVPLVPHVPPNNRDIVAAAQLVKDLTINFRMS
jgi:hypothetical protein